MTILGTMRILDWTPLVRPALWDPERAAEKPVQDYPVSSCQHVLFEARLLLVCLCRFDASTYEATKVLCQL